MTESFYIRFTNLTPATHANWSHMGEVINQPLDPYVTVVVIVVEGGLVR